MDEDLPAKTQDHNLPDSNITEMFSAFVTIPGPVFYSKQLSEPAKLLYGLLSAMHRAPRYYAWAKNSTLQHYLNDCSERKLQRCLKELEDAGEITIENGAGGKTIRKIRLTRVQPLYPDKNDGVYPVKNDGGIYNEKNNKRKNNRRGKAPVASQEDIVQWFNCWVAKQELSQEDSVALCTDLRDFVESRESAGKPFNTIQAAVRMGNRLMTLTKDSPYPVPLMRYLLSKSILNGWADVYGLKDENVPDFNLFLAYEYGIEAGTPDEDAVEYF
jgi:hypothetical protein